MKLPRRKSKADPSNELRSYPSGWNSIIEGAKDWCKKNGEEYAKKYLLKNKKFAYKLRTYPFYKGIYDCILEIERLNEEEQVEEKLKGYKRLIEDFDVDIRCDNELWTSKEKDDEGFSLQIAIDYVPPLSVSFCKRKGFESKNSFYILPDVIKAVNERLEEITGEEE